MAKPKVLLCGEIYYAHDVWKSLQDAVEVVIPQSTSRAEFIEECKSGKFDGCVVAYRTFFSVTFTGFFDEELVDVLPKSLKVVAHNGAGYDQVYPAALSKHDIILANCTTPVNDATADTALFLLIGALRGFAASQSALRENKFSGQEHGHDPEDKVLGILGMGGIGRNFARKCVALGMRIQYYNRNRLSEAEEKEAGDAKYVDMETLLSTSDVISVHVPLSKATTHLLSSAEFAKCKRGVCIINTARGAVIDEAALVKALEDGQVGSVGLDVFEEEPKVHPGLMKSNRAILLPHMGTWSYETQNKMETWSIGNVRCAVEWISKGNEEAGGKLSVVPEHIDLWQKLLKE